jgi:hypothetical protein
MNRYATELGTQTNEVEGHGDHPGVRGHSVRTDNRAASIVASISVSLNQL